MLAEDEEQIRVLAKAILEEAGYNVLIAVDGEEALRIYRSSSTPIDLLLFDVVMPRKGGREAFEAIRAMNPAIKCLFVSGYSQDAVHTNFVLDAGIRLLQKPYGNHQLLRAVRQVLDIKS